jgi:hypothetical protein
MEPTIMNPLPVDNFLFDFQPSVVAEKYDEWKHYLNVWRKVSSEKKGMDVVAVESTTAPITTWLIEAKDFRIITNPPNPSNLADLPQTVADKAAHTLAGLGDAAAKATDASEKNHAKRAIAAPIKRVVLHLEPHTGPHTKLFPIGFSASVLQKLRSLVKAIDSNPLVLNIANTPTAGVPWTVT